jgi:hypothetical protein
MARKAFALFACCFALAGAPSAQADPFGALYSWRETPDFFPQGLTTNPDIAKWLMTLPQPGSWREAGTDQAMNTEIFNGKPTAGVAYGLSPGAAPTSSAQVADASVARQLFDAEPMGSQPYRFTNPLAQLTALAANIDGTGANIEGRSASDGTDSATPRVHLETCTCLHK